MEIDELITYLIIIAVVAILIKIFSWLLPIFVILAVAYVIYLYITDNNAKWEIRNLNKNN